MPRLGKIGHHGVCSALPEDEVRRLVATLIGVADDDDGDVGEGVHDRCDAIELQGMLGDDLRRSLAEPHRVQLEDADPDTGWNVRIDRQSIVDGQVGELAVLQGEPDQRLAGRRAAAPRRRA